VPVHVVAERLGHSDPAITLRVYAHVIRRHAEGVAAKFTQAVDGALDLDDEDNEDDGPDLASVMPC
jgi:integrase